MYAKYYRGYMLGIRLPMGKDETECVIIDNAGDEVSVEDSSARARAVVDGWLDAR